jgi:hypothetical protein
LVPRMFDGDARALSDSGGALLPPRGSRSHSRDHGVSDPAAAVESRPAAALTGSLTPWLPTALVTVCESQPSGRKRRPGGSDVRASRAGKFPGESTSALDARIDRGSRDPRAHWPSRYRCWRCARRRARLSASLRPRCARPSGLDAASAQLGDRQSRDGPGAKAARRLIRRRWASH